MLKAEDQPVVIYAMPLRTTTRRTQLEDSEDFATKRTYGRTKVRQVIDDALIEQLPDETERGYDPKQVQTGRMARAAAARTRCENLESVRLDPALRDQAVQRAADEGTTVSEIIRRALRDYLRSA